MMVIEVIKRRHAGAHAPAPLSGAAGVVPSAARGMPEGVGVATLGECGLCVALR